MFKFTTISNFTGEGISKFKEVWEIECDKKGLELCNKIKQAIGNLILEEDKKNE